MDREIEKLKKRISELENEIAKDKQTGGNEQSQVEETEAGQPLMVHYKWQSPVRVFVPRDKVWFLKILLVALLLILLFAFLQELVVIVVIAVLVLITFLLATIPPHDVEHEITNKGIRSIGRMYKYKDLREFWAAEKLGQKLIYVSTKIRIPSRLILLVARSDEAQVIKNLSRYLPYSEYREKQSWAARISDGVMVNPKRYKDFLRKKKKKQSPEKQGNRRR